MGTPPQNPPAQERFVFLCHSMPDKELVRQIYVKLKQNGFTPWLDEENLEAGHDWEYEIHRAVHRASAVIVCLSKNSLTREGFVHRKIKAQAPPKSRSPNLTSYPRAALRIRPQLLVRIRPGQFLRPTSRQQKISGGGL